jgi:uncharacterized protein (TIGR03083 family)
MDADAALAALARVTSAMAVAVGAADHAAAVPACPGWDVTDLVDHLGRVHLWAAASVRAGRQPRPYPSRDTSQPLAQWYAACAAELVEVLAATPPERQVWTFFRPDRSAGFWRRRQVHETAVHLVDLLQATGGLPTDGLVTHLPHLGADEAADGVDEVLRVMLPRTLERLAPRPAGELVPVPRPVVLRAEGTGRSWTLVQEGDAVEVVDGERPDAVAVVAGPAVHLDLALWGRASRDVLEVTGAEAAGRRLLRASFVP